MTDLALWQIALAGLALLIAGAAKSGLGGAGGFAATPLMALALGPERGLGLMLPLLIVIDFATLAPYWRKWSWPDARVLLVAGTVGSMLGWLLFGLIDANATRIAVGGIALVFTLYRLATMVGWKPGGGAGFNARRAGIWGVVMGLTSFIAHGGGPPAAMALIPREMAKTTYQATVVIVFWWLNLSKLGPYVALGLVGDANLRLAAWFAPFALAGVVLGVIGHRRISQRAFDGAILVLLGASGVKLVADGIAGLWG